jgi:very-short-patch-repair endonuclease
MRWIAQLHWLHRARGAEGLVMKSTSVADYKKFRKESDGEIHLARDLTAAGIAHEREFRFHPKRQWRSDFRIGKWLIEVEGGVWNGGHKRGLAADTDCEKQNEAEMAGWRCLRFTTAMVRDGRALATIERALSEKCNEDYGGGGITERGKRT